MPVNSDARGRGIKASAIQQQFWLLNQHGNGSAYNVASAFYCTDIDKGKLLDSIHQTFAAYAIFNTEFFSEDGQLYQRQRTGDPCEFFDLHYDGERAQAIDILKQQAAQTFDYSQDALVRITLLTSSDDAGFYLLIVVPHIVIDLHTKNVLAKEIASRYRGQNVCFGDDNYAQYSEQLVDWLDTEQAQKQRDSWRKRLDNLSRTVTPMQAGEPAYVERELAMDSDLYHRLTAACAKQKTDPFIVLLAAFYWLLARFSQSEDFAIGVPLSNRKQAAFKNTLGCFVNTVPLLPRAEHKDFPSLISACRQALLHGHRYQDLPTVAILAAVNDVAHTQSASRALYNVGYTFEEPMELVLHEGFCESIFLPGCGPQLDFFLRLYEKQGQLYGRFEADTSFISASQLDGFQQSYLQLLASFVAEPGIQFPRYLPEQHARKIAGFNATDYDFGLDSRCTLTHHFVEQAARTPNALALVDAKTSLTYEQFDKASNRLANYLRRQGVAQDSVVAVYVERSIAMMVAIYGLLKAGAVYLPIDMDAPQDRVEYMLKQAGAVACLVARDQDRESLQAAITVIDVRSDAISEAEASLPQTNTHIDSPAYIIFTSGSTGLPKGVLNNHRGILNRLCWGNRFFSLSPSDRVLQKTPYSFDVSLWELFMPLQRGATLVLADHNSHKNPYEIARQIKHHHISMIHFVPSMLHAFLNSIDEHFDSIHTVFCSGEALSAALQQRTFERYPTIKLYNLYGPTEAAVEVTCWQCCNSAETAVPIGKPIDNVKLYIVDEQLQEVPIGVPGELLISGIQVAQAYVNNEELSRQAFIPNPFGANRVYRTGDQVRWRDDGAIEYIGRRDAQVKINGIRVELGEIENVALRFPAVEKAVVTYAKHDADKPILSVYYTLKQGHAAPLDVDDLKQHLATYLPRYLLPQAYIELDDFPIGASGKVDRKRLPAPPVAPAGVERKDHVRHFANDVERTIYGVWQAKLGREDMGLDDAFFELGGDSFALVDVYEQLKNTYPDTLSSVDVFRFTTIASLARHILGQHDDNGNKEIEKRAAKMKNAMRARHLRSQQHSRADNE